MPSFWQFPTASMGLGPTNAIYQARFTRYLSLADQDDVILKRLHETVDGQFQTYRSRTCFTSTS